MSKAQTPRTQNRFFGVVARPQTWLNLLYLGLSFPLGLFYFVFLTVCLSVGISLVIIWVGIFILGLTAACWWAFAAFERSLADGLLGTRLAPSPQPWRRAQGTWPRIKAHFTSGATWKDLAFLFLKFPLGVLSFVVVVSLGATSVGLVGAPFYYRFADSTGAHGVVHHGLYFGVWTIDRLWQALLLVPLGLLLAVVSLHAFNGLAAMWRGVAQGLLSPDTAPRPARVGAAGPAAPPPPGSAPSSVPTEPMTPQAPAQPTGWPAYPGYPIQPGATPGPSTPPAPAGAPGDQPPYGWLYYPPPYQPQPASRPTPPPAPQPGPVQPGAPQASGPWSGTPWAQWPPMFAPSPTAAPATGPAPEPTAPQAVAPEIAASEAATPEAAAPETAAAETATGGEPPAQEEQP
jgi:hypothetical protein